MFHAKMKVRDEYEGLQAAETFLADAGLHVAHFRVFVCSVTCFLCEHYIPREAKWGRVPIGSAHADDLFCNVEHLLDLALASVVKRVEFDDLTGLSPTPDLELGAPPRSVQLLRETLKAAGVLWPTRNYDAAIGGFATALSKLHEMKDDPHADLVEARMYRQMVSNSILHSSISALCASIFNNMTTS